MTVIAWDGHTLASDKQCSSGGLAGTVTKIHRVPQGLLGISGDYARIGTVLAWFNERDGAPKYAPKFQQDEETYVHLVLIRHDCTIWKYEHSCHPFLVEDKKFAIGSGRPYALAAMECGLSSVEAVKLACKFDIYCGKGYDVLSPLPMGQLLHTSKEPIMALSKQASQELVRKLRIAYHQEDLSREDHLLLQPLMTLFNNERTANCFNDKQIELITTIYNKYYEAK